jgi:hypothetical protein
MNTITCKNRKEFDEMTSHMLTKKGNLKNVGFRGELLMNEINGKLDHEVSRLGVDLELDGVEYEIKCLFQDSGCNWNINADYKKMIFIIENKDGSIETILTNEKPPLRYSKRGKGWKANTTDINFEIIREYAI